MSNLKIKKKVSDRYRSTMGYTFLSNIKFLIDKSQKKYYFSNLNSLGPPTPAIPQSIKVAQQSVGFQ